MNQKTNMPVKHATNEVNDATSVLAENDQKFSWNSVNDYSVATQTYVQLLPISLLQIFI